MRLNAIRFFILSSIFILDVGHRSTVFAQHGSVEVTTAPFEIKISDAQMRELSPEAQTIARTMVQQLTASIQRVTAVTINFPDSYFSGKDAIIHPRDLFILPSMDDELDKLSNQRFTPEQLHDIQWTGTFKVASLAFPAQFHLWKISVLLQRGKENISADILHRTGESLYEIRYEIPEAIFGDKPITIRDGLSRVGDGLRNSVDLLFGVKATAQRFAESEIAYEVEMGQAKFVYGRLKEAKLTKPVDLRLFAIDETSQKQLTAVKSQVNSLLTTSNKRWESLMPTVLEAIERDVAKEVSDGKLSPETAPQVISDRLADAYNQFIITQIRTSGIGEGDASLRDLLARNAEAQAIISKLELDFTEELETQVAEKMSKIAEASPRLASVEAWLNEQEETVRQKIYYEAEPRFMERIIVALNAAGLEQEAAGVKYGYVYKTTLQRTTEEQLRAERVPTIERRFEQLRSWSPKKWIEKDAHGRYFLQPYAEKIVDSGAHFWRVRAGLARWGTTFANWTHALVVGSPTNGRIFGMRPGILEGSLGLRSLVERRAFDTVWRVDPQTGELQRQGGRVETLASRINNLRGLAAQNRADFAARRGGIIGKFAGRIALFVWNDVGVGFVAPLAVGLGQPVLTVANLALSAAGVTLAATPLPAALEWAFNATIYNGDYQSSGRYRRGRFLERFLPPITEVAIPAVMGAAETSLGIVRAGVYHPLRAGGFALSALWSATVRRGYDALVFHGLIKPFGRTIDHDSRFEAKRLSGPGLSSNMFFQVKPDLVLLVLRAALEKAVAEHYIDEGVTATKAPADTYASILGESLKYLAGQVGYDKSSPLAQLQSDAKTVGQSIQNQSKETIGKLDALLTIPHSTNIRLSQIDLIYVLKMGAAMTEKLLKAEMEKWSPEARAAFWKSYNVKEGDFVALAKALLEASFSSEISRPLEAIDRTMVIVIDPPGLGDRVKDLYDGIVKTDLDKFKVEDPGARHGTDRPATRLIELNESLICEATVGRLHRLKLR